MAIRQADYQGIVDYGLETDRYKWTQNDEDVSITFKIGPGLKGKDLNVKMTRDYLLVGVKGKAPFIDGKLGGEIKVDDSAWCLDNDVIEMTLQKSDKKWWASVIIGDEEIDVDLIEGSKYLDANLLQKVKNSKLEKKESERKAREELIKNTPEKLEKEQT